MGKFLVWMLVAGLAGLLLWVDDALVWILDRIGGVVCPHSSAVIVDSSSRAYRGKGNEGNAKLEK